MDKKVISWKDAEGNQWFMDLIEGLDEKEIIDSIYKYWPKGSRIITQTREGHTMAIFEISSPVFDRRNPKCRACRYYGANEGFAFSAECQCKDNNIKNRRRDHNDKACSFFRLTDWLKGGNND